MLRNVPLRAVDMSMSLYWFNTNYFGSCQAISRRKLYTPCTDISYFTLQLKYKITKTLGYRVAFFSSSCRQPSCHTNGLSSPYITLSQTTTRWRSCFLRTYRKRCGPNRRVLWKRRWRTTAARWGSLGEMPPRGPRRNSGRSCVYFCHKGSPRVGPKVQTPWKWCQPRCNRWREPSVTSHTNDLRAFPVLILWSESCHAV